MEQTVMRNRKAACEGPTPLPCISYTDSLPNQGGTDCRNGSLHYSTRSPRKGQTPDTYSPSSSSGYSGSDVDDANDDVKSDTISSDKGGPKWSLSGYDPDLEEPLLKERNAAPESRTISEFLSGSSHMVTSAEEFVKHVIHASWDVVHHHHLPHWLQDNEYLLFGHRLPLYSFRACFRSVFRIHTETGNIWSHLLGMIAFIFIAGYTLGSRYLDWVWQDITVHSAFFAGAIVCLTFSWLYHTMFCHSESVNKLFSKLDYCGIALLVVGSFVPFLYYSFHCHFVAHMVYLLGIIGLGTSCIVVSLFDKFATPAFRPIRAGLFIAFGLTGVIPAIHIVLLEGFYTAVFEYGLLHLVTMAVLYIAGALIYAFRVPESIYPGKFDIWFQSHQIFHMCVLAAALVHFRGIQVISAVRIGLNECPLHA